MSHKIKIGKPEDFTPEEREAFKILLVKQNKVKNVSDLKINRCKYLCMSFVDGKPVSIGAIKPKTVSDFKENKANLPDLEKAFEWELGYFYTDIDHQCRGYGSEITETLIQKTEDINLMASTELAEKNSMKRILERTGFTRKGSAWKSQIHGGELGLFIKQKAK